MYGRVKRDIEYIMELKKFIEKTYGFMILEIKSAIRSFYGETWRLDANDGKSYFLKLDYATRHKDNFRLSLPILDYLARTGVENISTVVKTLDGKLYKKYDRAILALFDWIESVRMKNDETTKNEFLILAKIYKLPYDNLVINTEDFTAHCLDTFDELLMELRNDANEGHYSKLLKEIDERKSILFPRITKLKNLAKKCRKDFSNFFITHGDPQENIIVSENGYYLIDWEHPLLAPPERDAWTFLNSDNDLDAFTKALHEVGINYKFKRERLEYYCYYSFFRYLNEIIKAYYDLPQMEDEAAFQIIELFDGWIEDTIWFTESITSSKIDD